VRRQNDKGVLRAVTDLSESARSSLSSSRSRSARSFWFCPRPTLMWGLRPPAHQPGTRLCRPNSALARAQRR